MMGSRQHGFTIIEVILFLAISGMMITVLLVTVSGGINRERYRDAVSSFTDFMQGQYNLTDNVRNDRTSSTVPGCAGADRATSACTIIGRLVTTDALATHVYSYPVITSVDITKSIDSGVTEDEYVKSLNLSYSTTDSVESYDMAWQTSIVQPASANPRTFSMLLLRSPFSSAIKTYYVDGITTDIATIVDTAITSSVALCVSADGVGIPMVGVIIDPRSASSAAIQAATPEDCD